MTLSLATQSIASLGASRSASLRGAVVAAAAYYFFGYWFSHRRL